MGPLDQQFPFELCDRVQDGHGELAGGTRQVAAPQSKTVKFGEAAEVAVVREFHEELGIVVQVVSPPTFIENIFSHEGSLGHEIVAIFDVSFPPDAFASEEGIEFTEGGGTTCFAEWFSLDALDLPEGPQLYPSGLKAHLLSKG